MENFYNSIPQKNIEFIEFDGLYLTGQQMQKIANDKMILVRWKGELIHLCRCEPITNFDTFEICYAAVDSHRVVPHHIHMAGKTLCGHTLTDKWQVEKKKEWIRRCKICESLIDKG